MGENKTSNGILMESQMQGSWCKAQHTAAGLTQPVGFLPLVSCPLCLF